MNFEYVCFVEHGEAIISNKLHFPFFVVIVVEALMVGKIL